MEDVKSHEKHMGDVSHDKRLETDMEDVRSHKKSMEDARRKEKGVDKLWKVKSPKQNLVTSIGLQATPLP